MNGATLREGHMAPKPVPRLDDELKKLGFSDREVMELLHPGQSEVEDNIATGFTGLDDWIREGHESRDPHALRGTVDKYKRKRKEYQDDVLRQLRMIRHFKVGQAVQAEIARRRPFSVVIKPFRGDDQNAESGLSHLTKTPDAGPLGMTILDTAGNKALHQKQPLYGTGKGTDIRVDYTPGLWGTHSKVHGPGTGPDEVLLHELVHASRQIGGVARSRAVGGKYDNEEEFIAIMIDNIYLSEKNQTQLRAHHDGHTILASPDKFLDNVQKLTLPAYRIIELFRWRQPILYADLAAIGPGHGPGRAKFNPVREWDQKRKNVLIDL
jgi:hypothetical protein